MPAFVAATADRSGGLYRYPMSLASNSRSTTYSGDSTCLPTRRHLDAAALAGAKALVARGGQARLEGSDAVHRFGVNPAQRLDCVFHAHNLGFDCRRHQRWLSLMISKTVLRSFTVKGTSGGQKPVCTSTKARARLTDPRP